MMSNLIDLLTPQAPHEQGRFYGVVVGIVTNNQDPDKMARVRVKFPWLSDDHESWWARIATPMAGGGRGTYFLPEVNDEVLVAFEHGDVRSPYVIGCLHGKVDKPPHSRSSSTDIRTVLTPSGSEISFDEKKKTISLNTKKGASVVLKEDSGEITLTATKKITLDADEVLINGKSGVKVTSKKIELN